MDNRREDQNCYICNCDLFSSITRMLGKRYVCVTCLGSVMMLKEAFETDLADRAKDCFATTSGRPANYLLEAWAEDFGIQLS